MSLRERIRAMAEALPTESARVELSRADLLTMLEEGGSAERSPKDQEPLMDLSVAEIMVATGKARSTVIGWINSGGLDAYHFGREWRITRAAWHAYLQTKRSKGRAKTEGGKKHTPQPKHADGLGSWRSVVGGAS